MQMATAFWGKRYIQIMRGALILANEELQWTLYQLIGEIIVNDAMAANAMSELVMTCQRRLDHISQ